MSLILEALRKSEAERQRGRAPGLFVEQVSLRPAARSRTPAWAWVLGGLFLALLLVFGWREWSRQAAPADPAAANPAAEATAQEIPPRPAADPSPQAAIPSPRPMAARDAASAPAAEPRPALPGPVAAAPPASRPAPPAAAPVLAAAPTPAAPPPSPPAPAALPQESLPSLGSLDAGTRAQLPPLKLSMHVFAPEPAKRFVILDGQRLGEGANPASGVVLEEIRRDGLVLSVNGQRLLLARP